MTDELERAVERVSRMADWLSSLTDAPAPSSSPQAAKDLRALLSERSELLAAVERMRGAVTGLLGFMGQLSPAEFVAALYWHNTPGLELTTRGELEANLNTAIAAGFAALVARAALTTGEGK